MIDFHTHIFPDKIAARAIAKLEGNAHIKAASSGTLDGLRESMIKADMECSIILPVMTKPEQFQSVNEYAAYVNATYGNATEGRLHSFGGIHPDSEHYKEELKTIKELGLLGVKLHPDYQETKFDDIRYMRIVDYASELGLTIVVHAGVDIGLPDPVHCTPQMSLRVINEVQPEKLVLAHMGGYELWNDVEDLLVGRRVYFDTAYSFGRIPDEQFLRIVENHGADRIIFATDNPWSDPKTDSEYLKKILTDEESLNAILAENAKALLGWN